MPKKMMLSVLGVYLCVAALHISLNIGIDRLGLFSEKHRDSAIAKRSIRVGFLPVT